MGAAVVRAATDDDWPALVDYYARTYRPDHPLVDRATWRWRFGDPVHGRALLAVDGDRIVGHLGVARADGLAWMINVHLEPSHRGQGILRRLYGTAREDGPLITTGANALALNAYRNMGWHRLADLERHVAWRADVEPARLLDPVDVGPDLAAAGWVRAGGHHYWEQPGLVGWVAPDGSSVVDARSVGGLRVVELADPDRLPELAWDLGVRWLDYLTSWNDPLCRDLASQGWLPDRRAPVPWLLDPVVVDSRAEVTVLCPEPIDPRLVIRRWHGDHGRVGSRPDPSPPSAP